MHAYTKAELKQFQKVLRKWFLVPRTKRNNLNSKMNRVNPFQKNGLWLPFAKKQYIVILTRDKIVWHKMTINYLALGIEYILF